MLMPYFANVGPVKGPVKHRDVPGSIGVLEVPDNPGARGFAGAVYLPLPWGVADVDACLPPRM